MFHTIRVEDRSFNDKGLFNTNREIYTLPYPKRRIIAGTELGTGLQEE
jgi:hypothetical protein